MHYLSNRIGDIFDKPMVEVDIDVNEINESKDENNNDGQI